MNVLSCALRQAAATLGVLALLAGLSVIPSTPAAAAPAQAWGYVWGDQPTAASYTPSFAYQFNSTNNLNTIAHGADPGAYRITFPGLGTAGGGTVHVTSYGGATEQCKVSSWWPSGSNLLVDVRCFNLGGTPADSRFTATYTSKPSGSTPMGYVWNDRLSCGWTGCSYTPSAGYQFNSAGASNTITWNSTGDYAVRLPFLAAPSGHVQVTAYGGGSERCKVVGWGPTGADQLVNVRCFNSTGGLTDSLFTVTYVKGASIVGSAPYVFGHAYVWADQPTSLSYTPNTAYQFNSTYQFNKVTRRNLGQYAITLPSQNLSWGDVQVTAYGSGAEFCKVSYWTPSDGVIVNCFNASGSPTDTKFDAAFLFSELIF